MIQRERITSSDWMDDRLAPNFQRYEFACRCGCGYADPTPALVAALQRVRNCMQAAVHVESGCRCKRHNLAVGGELDSQHLIGNAADIYVDGHFNRLMVCVKADEAFAEGGVGVYAMQLPERTRAWLHVDVRGYRARWQG